MIENLKLKAKQLKNQIGVLYLAYMHKDVKWYKKAFLLLILIYAVSPIDLIPDFIPVLGMLDDIILIPLGVVVAIKIIPHNIWEECRVKAENGISIEGKYKKIGAVSIVLVWIYVLVLVVKGFI